MKKILRAGFTLKLPPKIRTFGYNPQLKLGRSFKRAALFEQQHSKMSTHMTETGNMLNVRKPKKEVLITSVSNNAGKQNKNSVSQSHVKIGNPKRHQIDPSI